MNSNTVPSILSSLRPVVKKYQETIVIPITKKRRVENIFMFTATGESRSTMPRIRVMFVRHDPMVVPIAIVWCFVFIAVSDTESSGREVPIAIMVAPITDSAMPIIDETLDVEDTTKVDDIITITIPKISKARAL